MADRSLTRRDALTGLAVGGLGLPLLAACGGSDGGSAGTEPKPGTTLTPTSAVPVGGGVILGAMNVVVTQPEKGTFRGFSATCTHEGCLLSSVAGGTINCACHGSQFSIGDGRNVAGPSGTPAGTVAPLPTVPIKVRHGNVVEGRSVD